MHEARLAPPGSDRDASAARTSGAGRLVLLAALLAAVDAAAAPPGTAPPPDPGVRTAPKGSPADEALWEKLVSTQDAVTISRADAVRLMRKLDQARPDLRLAELAGRAGQAADRAGPLRRRLLEAWNTAFQVLVRPWPVDPRLGCRSERIDLEVAMEGAAAPDLERARAMARPCLEKMASAVDQMVQANRALVAVIAEVEAALPPGQPAAPPSPAGQESAAPATPPATLPARP